MHVYFFGNMKNELEKFGNLGKIRLKNKDIRDEKTQGLFYTCVPYKNKNSFRIVMKV